MPDNKILQLETRLTQIINLFKDDTPIVNELIFNSTEHIFKIWAETLEELHKQGQYVKSLNTISIHIRHEIGKMTFQSDELIRKENLYQALKSIDDKYKEDRPNQEVEILPKKTPDFKITPDYTFFMDGLQHFTNYHDKFSDIAKDLIKKIKKDRILYTDLEKVTEWEEIARFSHYLAELEQEFSLLDQITNEQNIKESATILQRAMAKILHADGAYRQMAYKFGISARQGKRVRQRDENWPKKDVTKIIQNIQSSYICPCGCQYNLVTQKKYHDITNDKVFQKFRWKEKNFKIPDNLKHKRVNPIDIARLVFAKKLKLVAE